MFKLKGPKEKIQIRSRANPTSTKSDAGLGAMEEWVSSADRLHEQFFLFVVIGKTEQSVVHSLINDDLSIIIKKSQSAFDLAKDFFC